MDEVSFGTEREFRLPPRYRRALTGVAACVVIAGVVTVGVALAHRSTSADTRTGAGPSTHSAASSPIRADEYAQPACPPAQAARPNLAALPAGMRPGALKGIIDAQFSGRCPVSR